MYNEHSTYYTFFKSNKYLKNSLIVKKPIRQDIAFNTNWIT